MTEQQKWEKYEQYKKKLRLLNISNEEYLRRLKEYTDKNKL